MISGQQVTLRPIKPTDRDLLRRWQSDPAILRGWGKPRLLMAEGAIHRVVEGSFSQFDDQGFFIIDAESGPVGRIDFEIIDRRHASAEIAMYVGEVTAQRRRYATDALRTLTSYLFLQRGLNRIELTVISSNDAARTLAERIGFRLEGILRDHTFVDGQFHDEFLMAMRPVDPAKSKED